MGRKLQSDGKRGDIRSLNRTFLAHWQYDPCSCWTNRDADLRTAANHLVPFNPNRDSDSNGDADYNRNRITDCNRNAIRHGDRGCIADQNHNRDAHRAAIAEAVGKAYAQAPA